MLKKRIMPLLLILAGLWGLAGCIWLPIPEHQVSKGKDFRDFLGSDPDHPRRLGIITRAMVIAALGPPRLQSKDGHAIGYTTQRDSGLEIWPLCFAINDEKALVLGARLIFDDADRLTSWEIRKDSVRVDSSFMRDRAKYLEWDLIYDLNKSGPTLRPLGSSFPRSINDTKPTTTP